MSEPISAHPRSSPTLDRIRSQMEDASLLTQALTHASYDNDHNYERLEFLGDAVLGMVIVERIYRDFPRAPEGPLARLKAYLGSAVVLSKVAKKHGFFEAARFGEMPAAQLESARQSVGADLVEAIIGAVYLDRGLPAARALIYELLGERLTRASLDVTAARDAKTQLHELIQGAIHKRPSYHVVEEDGPAHARRFHVEVQIEGVSCGKAWGNRRKVAEQGAAQQALDAIARGDIDLANLYAIRQ